MAGTNETIEETTPEKAKPKRRGRPKKTEEKPVPAEEAKSEAVDQVKEEATPQESAVSKVETAAAPKEEAAAKKSKRSVKPKGEKATRQTKKAADKTEQAEKNGSRKKKTKKVDAPAEKPEDRTVIEPEAENMTLEKTATQRNIQETAAESGTAVEGGTEMKTNPKTQKTVEKLRVLMIGSECVPFAKTGGLADVLGTLPQALNKLDVDARVMIPFHKQAKEKYRMQTEHVTDYYIYLGWKSMFVGIDKLELNGVTYYLIDNEDMFGGPIYKGEIPEGEQYAFFARAACEAMDRIDFVPQVVHCNDWQCGMIPMLLKTQYLHRPQSGAKTVFSIHNLMYQGQYSFAQVQEWFGIEDRYNTPEFIEHFGCASFMKAGLVFCDRISTVSPTYAEEIRIPYFSYGMEGILNARAHETIGILNGMNMEEFDPATDPKIPYKFTPDNLEGKRKDKEALLMELGLNNVDLDTPLIGMVGRLTHQKGLNLLMPIFDELMRERVAIVILGTGDSEYENFFRSMESVYRGRVCAYIGYSDDVAHRIYAGSDLFLMPSKFEPCGISQMIALRYGTLPIVRETGGLKDTVIPYNEFTGKGNGFSFTNYNAYDMLKVIRYALYVIQDKEHLASLQKAAFASDYSFAKSAGMYRDMFRSLL